MAIVVIIIMFFLLVRNMFEPVVIFIAGSVVFISTGIISIDEALSGFSNKGVITVAVLFIIAGSIQKTSYIYSFANQFLGKRGEGKRTHLRIMFPVTVLSAFINNTPVVAIFIPMIRKWAINNNISPSKLLIPISYASIFGGLLTLIGTSTNLVVSGLLEEYGFEPLGMFEISKIGICLVVLGFLYMILIGRRLLPENEDLITGAKKQYREYLVTMIVEEGCKIVDKTVAKSGLRNLDGLYLFEIIREGERIHPINPEKVIIQEADELVFTGRIDTIVQVQSIPGLRLESSCEDYERYLGSDDMQIVEVVVSDSFPFLDQSIKESNFRAKYDAAVIAVLRRGKRVNQKIGDIKLQTGDTLLMLTSKDFFNTWSVSKDFYIISNNIKVDVLEEKKGIKSVIAFFVLIILASFNILSILHASLLALAFLMLTRTIRPKEAWRNINWDTIIVIALSFGIGKGLINSGGADLIAGGIVVYMKNFGPTGAILAVLLITIIFTEMITNNAAAVLAFPIAITIANQMGLDPRLFAIAVAVGASTCFASPIGYQTNMMVYGPGGYKFTDYVKVGLPLDLIFMIATVLLLPILY